jgi:hypothetical protein
VHVCVCVCVLPEGGGWRLLSPHTPHPVTSGREPDSGVATACGEGVTRAGSTAPAPGGGGGRGALPWQLAGVPPFPCDAPNPWQLAAGHSSSCVLVVLLAAALRHCAVRGPRGGVLRVRGRPGCVYVYVECVSKGGGGGAAGACV